MQEQALANRDCSECGHELQSDINNCAFCGAPQFQKSGKLGNSEAVKWAAFLLLIYGIFHISWIM